jgi:NADH-quinone oxidoreductase subunit N
MAGGEDLMVVFLGLELLSVAVYVLAGINRKSASGAEAAFKYFLLGAFASGFLLYGIALVYGATGTTGLRAIGAQVGAGGGGGGGGGTMLVIGLALLLIGFGFKLAAVPFHMWVPDVYDGSPTPVAAYMASGVKAAAFAALFRVLGEAFPAVAAWHQIVWWLAVATMVVGNLVALAQRTVKRMLAYSSIAHAGYLLVAVAAGRSAGSAAFLFYLVAYTLTTLAAFALLAAKGREGERDVLIDDLAGLGTRRPWLAFALAVCMLSLLGFPGTAGFIGKWYILLAATAAGQLPLAAILVLTSVISAGYYLPVIMAMYMQPEPFEQAHAGMRIGRLGSAAVAVSVAGLLLLGIRPNRLLDLAKTSGDGLAGVPAAAPQLQPSGR